MKLKILIYEAEEGGYWAKVPALRGCVSEGETMDETLSNIKEAALGWLETAQIIPDSGSILLAQVAKLCRCYVVDKRLYLKIEN